jgi:hypothetical protein
MKSLLLTSLFVGTVLGHSVQGHPNQTPSAGVNPVVAGTTTYVDGTTYKALDGVQVTVMRKAPVKGDTSKNGGHFRIEYEQGTPVYVLFDTQDNRRLPELQSLSGASKLTHEVHVTLYTIEQAKEQKINPYGHVKAVLDALEAAGVDPKSEPMQRLRTLLSKLG